MTTHPGQKKRRMSDAEWERWIGLFRLHPGQTVKVAGLMGVPRNRARIAWYHGWPKQGRPPIAELIEEDKAIARVTRAEMEQTAEEKAKKEQAEVRELAKRKDVVDKMVERDATRKKMQADSAKTRAQEGMLVNVSRGNSLALAAATASLLKGAQELSKRMHEQLKHDQIPLREAIGILQKVAIIARMNAEQSVQVLEMERLIMGQPDGDEPRTGGGGRLSPAEAAEWLKMTMQTVRKFEQRRANRLGDGDAGTTGKPEAGRTIVVAAPDDGDDDGDDDSDVAAVGRTG